MLTDPTSLTYNGSSVTLPRATAPKSGVAKKVAETVYASNSGEFVMRITRFAMGDGTERSEVLLTRVAPDADGPFTGSYRSLPNSFGVVYEVNSLRYNTTTDIALLRSTLLAFLDTTVQSRVIAGEA